MKISNADGVEFEQAVTVPTATLDGHAINKGQADDSYAPIGGSGTGDVIGPSGATDDNIATYDGGVAKTNITGTLLQSGGANTHTHDDHSNLSHSGTAVGDHANHAHSGSADHASHTHSVTSNVAVGQHNANTTGQASAGSTSRGSTSSTLTLATHTHSTPALTHSVTNNAVTSGNESASLTHGNTGNETSTLSHSVTQPSDHDISGHSTADNIPTFFALAFIMRTA